MNGQPVRQSFFNELLILTVHGVLQILQELVGRISTVEFSNKNIHTAVTFTQKDLK